MDICLHSNCLSLQLTTFYSAELGSKLKNVAIKRLRYLNIVIIGDRLSLVVHVLITSHDIPFLRLFNNIAFVYPSSLSEAQRNDSM